MSVPRGLLKEWYSATWVIVRYINAFYMVHRNNIVSSFLTKSILKIVLSQIFLSLVGFIKKSAYIYKYLNFFYKFVQIYIRK